MQNIEPENGEAIPEEVLGEPTTEEKCQEGRNDAFDRMTRQEVPKAKIVQMKYLGGKCIDFGDHCWRKEAKETKKGIHVISTIPSSEIKTYHLVAKEAKVVRGERQVDQEKLDAISEILISSNECILASFKSSDVIVPRICALQPRQYANPNATDKIGYILNLFFLPSNMFYRELPNNLPEYVMKSCRHKICKEPIDETVNNNIQDYMGMVFIVYNLNFYLWLIKTLPVV